MRWMCSQHAWLECLRHFCMGVACRRAAYDAVCRHCRCMQTPTAGVHASCPANAAALKRGGPPHSLPLAAVGSQCLLVAIAAESHAECPSSDTETDGVQGWNAWQVCTAYVSSSMLPPSLHTVQACRVSQHCRHAGHPHSPPAKPACAERQ